MDFIAGETCFRVGNVRGLQIKTGTQAASALHVDADHIVVGDGILTGEHNLVFLIGVGLKNTVSDSHAILACCRINIYIIGIGR